MKTVKDEIKTFPKWFEYMLPKTIKESELPATTEGLLQSISSYYQSGEGELNEESSKGLPIPYRFLNSGAAVSFLSLSKFDSIREFLKIIEDDNSSYLVAAEFVFDEAEKEDAEQVLVSFSNFFYQNTMQFKDIFVKLKHHATGKIIYTLKERVVDLLIKTDVGSDLTANFLRAPEDRPIYVEFEKNDMSLMPSVMSFKDESITNQGLSLLAGQSCDVELLEGFYIHQNIMTKEWATRRITDNGRMNMGYAQIEHILKNTPGSHDLIRTISLHFNAKPTLNDSGELVLDTGFNYLEIFIPEYSDDSEDQGEINLNDLIDLHFSFWEESYAWPDEFYQNQKELLKLAITSLLYISFSDYREEVNEWDDVRRKLETVGTKKRDKVERRLKRSVNRIYISSSKLEKEVSSSGLNGRTVSAHYRRGHFKSQRYGEGYSKVKVIWIQPTLVGAKDESVKLKSKTFK